MNELDASLCEGVGGGLSPLGAWTAVGLLWKAGGVLYDGINAMGATLRNYYGDEATLEAFRGGNLGA